MTCWRQRLEFSCNRGGHFLDAASIQYLKENVGAEQPQFDVGIKVSAFSDFRPSEAKVKPALLMCRVTSTLIPPSAETILSILR